MKFEDIKLLNIVKLKNDKYGYLEEYYIDNNEFLVLGLSPRTDNLLLKIDSKIDLDKMFPEAGHLQFKYQNMKSASCSKYKDVKLANFSKYHNDEQCCWFNIEEIDSIINRAIFIPSIRYYPGKVCAHRKYPDKKCVILKIGRKVLTFEQEDLLNFNRFEPILINYEFTINDYDDFSTNWVPTNSCFGIMSRSSIEQHIPPHLQTKYYE